MIKRKIIFFMEKWVDIKGYEGFYQVSNEGRIKSCERKVVHKNRLLTIKEKILKQQKDSHGYLKVSLSKTGKVLQYLVHRLVAKAFIPNTDNLPEVNHKDECKQNNSVENLEWCTAEYNSNYGTIKNRIREKVKKNTIFNTNNPNPPKKVYQYNLNNELINVYPSTSNIVKTFGYKQQTLSRHCIKQDIYKGYKWSYVPLKIIK